VLKAENLSYGPAHFPDLQQGLNFHLQAGELLHVKGDNGAGKSLLARVILGSLKATSGSLQNSFSNRYLPQMQNKSAHLPYTLGEILSFRPAQPDLGLIQPSAHSLSWNKASGGERQRTLLTRFFQQEGDLLILDEPFNHLDIGSKGKVRELLRRAFADRKVAIILISHDDAPSEWLPGILVKELELKGRQ
jgi:zinc transport system ATP-binding protein